MKKEWQKPEMTFLTRNKPEEAVLESCKDYQTGIVGGPDNFDGQCYSDPICMNCVDQSVS